MEVTLLYFADCPHWQTADARLRQLADELGFDLRHREVRAPDEIEALGFRGSPTILVDGRDPFAGAGQQVSGLACRLYDTADGPEGVPSAAQLRAALLAQPAAGAPSVAELASAVQRMDVPLSDEGRRVARAAFELLAQGSPVPVAELAARAETSADEVDRTLAIGQAVLTGADDGPGEVLAFGGLSLAETEHRLTIDGRELYVWCAWDPLFLLPLLGRSGHVSSRCPVTGTEIDLLIRPDGSFEANPPTTTLSFTAPSECCADVRSAFCQLVRYFADEEAARTWTALRPGTFPLSLADGAELASLVNADRYGGLST